MKVNGLSRKLIVLLLISSLIPLLIFGGLSILSARQSASQAVREGNFNVAIRAADQIELYVQNGINILKGLSNNVKNVYLPTNEKNTIVNNYVISYDQFESLYITDKKGFQVATSALDGTLVDMSETPEFEVTSQGEIYLSKIYISENLIPTMTVGVPFKRFNRFNGMVVGTLNLLDMWTLVDSIKIGNEGFAYVVSNEGLLIAHGKPDHKVKVIQQAEMTHLPIVRKTLDGESLMEVYDDFDKVKSLGVSAPMKTLGWALIIEQPTAEAYASARNLSFQLVAMILFFLIAMTFLGTIGGRRYILEPILKIISVTREVGEGKKGVKVHLDTGDEFAELGQSFNRMTDQLGELQKEIINKEREATFGKIAAGLIHDLKHPVESIRNNCRLIQSKYEDAEYRAFFKKVIEREFDYLNRFLGDLHSYVKPRNLVLIPIDINAFIADILESIEEEMRKRGVTLENHPAPAGLKVKGDKFSLTRVMKNIMINGIQAMDTLGKEEQEKEKILTVTTTFDETTSQVLIEIEDRGEGIEPERMGRLFTDYATTKKKGLGLGLAITKRIIDQHNGEIEVRSVLGEGSSFTVRLPSA